MNLQCSCVWSQVVVGEKNWTRSTEFRCKELTYTVTGLKEGGDYYIRVVAVNDAGPGAPGVTEPVTVKEPQGRNTLHRLALKKKNVRTVSDCKLLSLGD